MRKFIFLIVLIVLTSCSSSAEKKELAHDDWKGLKTTALQKHPYFKNLPLQKINNKSGIETWIFRDQTRFQTDAYCQSLGGCLGMPTYNCNNIFSVEDGVILDFEQKGSCPGVKTIEAP